MRSKPDRSQQRSRPDRSQNTDKERDSLNQCTTTLSFMQGFHGMPFTWTFWISFIPHSLNATKTYIVWGSSVTKPSGTTRPSSLCFIVYSGQSTEHGSLSTIPTTCHGDSLLWKCLLHHLSPSQEPTGISTANTVKIHTFFLFLMTLMASNSNNVIWRLWIA